MGIEKRNIASPTKKYVHWPPSIDCWPHVPGRKWILGQLTMVEWWSEKGYNILMSYLSWGDVTPQICGSIATLWIELSGLVVSFAMTE